MSKVTISEVIKKEQFPSLDKIKGKHFGVPIFYTYVNRLYCLIRDLDDTLRVVDVENGHVQTGYKYDSVEDFYNRIKNGHYKFVDVEIVPTEIR